jgi:hypothetical protein
MGAHTSPAACGHKAPIGPSPALWDVAIACQCPFFVGSVAIRHPGLPVPRGGSNTTPPR